MLDTNLKPWLLEVNSSPAMSIDNSVDSIVKPALIKDTLKLCSFEPYEQYMERTQRKPSKVNPVSANFFSTRASGKVEGQQSQGNTQTQPNASQKKNSTYGNQHGSRNSYAPQE